MPSLLSSLPYLLFLLSNSSTLTSQSYIIEHILSFVQLALPFLLTTSPFLSSQPYLSHLSSSLPSLPHSFSTSSTSTAYQLSTTSLVFLSTSSLISLPNFLTFQSLLPLLLLTFLLLLSPFSAHPLLWPAAAGCRSRLWLVEPPEASPLWCCGPPRWRRCTETIPAAKDCLANLSGVGSDVWAHVKRKKANDSEF